MATVMPAVTIPVNSVRITRLSRRKVNKIQPNVCNIMHRILVGIPPAIKCNMNTPLTTLTTPAGDLNTLPQSSILHGPEIPCRRLDHRPTKKDAAIPLPDAVKALLVQHLDHFDATLEGEHIILSFKEESPASTMLPLSSRPTNGRTPRVVDRPKFTYRAVDRTLTLPQAQKYLSEQRYLVYQAVYGAPKGIQTKDLIERTGLPNGTVQQVLHWLKKQKMVTGEPETT